MLRITRLHCHVQFLTWMISMSWQRQQAFSKYVHLVASMSNKNQFLYNGLQVMIYDLCKYIYLSHEKLCMKINIRTHAPYTIWLFCTHTPQRLYADLLFTLTYIWGQFDLLIIVTWLIELITQIQKSLKLNLSLDKLFNIIYIYHSCGSSVEKHEVHHLVKG